MEIKPLLSYTLLATLLLFSSLHPLIFSYSTFHRRLLNKPPHTHINTMQQFLTPHNVVRAKLALPPLKWSKKLTRLLSWWTQHLQGDCTLAHSSSDYGENLFWGRGRDWKPSEAVATWAEERSYYHYKSNRCMKNRDCLHNTQMVWKQSLKVGCAQTVCESGDTFITCNYDPHGNVICQKPF